MNESKSLCMLPWMHRFTNEQGFRQLCCTGHGQLNQLRDAKGNPLNISQGLTDAELLHSPDMKAIRRPCSRANGQVPAPLEGPGQRIALAEFLSFSEKSDREFHDSWRKSCPELEQLLTARN